MLIWQLIRSKTRDFAQRGLQLSLPLSLFICNSFEYFSRYFTNTAHQNSTREHKYAAVNWESVQRTCNEQVFLPWWRPSALSAHSTVNASKDNISPLDVYIESVSPRKRVLLICLNPRLRVCVYGCSPAQGGYVPQCLVCFIQFRIIHFCPEQRWTTSRRPKFASFDISTSKQCPVSRLMMGPF